MKKLNYETWPLKLGKEQTLRRFKKKLLRRILGLEAPRKFYNERLRNLCKSHDGSVGIALGYGLDDRGSRFRFPAGAGNFSLHHRVHNGSGAYPASYPMRTRGSFPGGKATGA
jgi:hypothetical protein